MKIGVHNKALTLGFLLTLLLLLPLAALAAEFRAAEQTSTENDEVIESNAYLAGGSVTSAATVQGDLAAAGGNVVIQGPVWVDLAAAGGTVTVSADVGDDLRALGGTIIVQGNIKKDLVVAGGQITISGRGVGGDAALAGGSIDIEAPVGGSVRITGGTIRINAPIEGDVDIKTDKLTLGPKALIRGDLTYSAPSAATMEEGAQVLGATNFNERSPKNGALIAAGIAGFITLWLFAKLLMTIVGAFALYFIFGRYTQALVDGAVANPLPSFVIGLLFTIATPVIAVMLLVSIVGLPIGILFIAAYIGAMIIGSFVAPIVLGSYAHHLFSKRGYAVSWKTILLGVLIYFILTLIPFVGWIGKMIVFWIALGSALSIKWTAAKAWR